MCSTENQNHLATSKMLGDTLVSFKPNSELKKYIHQKTRIKNILHIGCDYSHPKSHHRTGETI